MSTTNWNAHREPYNRELVFSIHMAICGSFRDGGSNHMTTHTNSVGMWVGSAGLGCLEQITAQHVWTNPCVTDGQEWALLYHSCYCLSLYVLFYFPVDWSHHSVVVECLYTGVCPGMPQRYILVLVWSTLLVAQQPTWCLEEWLVYPHFFVCCILIFSVAL